MDEIRLINAAPLMKNGWVLERHGISNCLLSVMSLADVPTIDPESLRPNGKWGNPIKVDADNIGYKCSECGEFGVPCWHYCPNCGARMEG